MDLVGNMVGALLGTTVVLLLVGPILLFWAMGVLLFVASALPSSHRLRETFRCPWTKRVVTADFLVPEGAAHPSEVVSCTAFRDPQKVTCRKPCREFADVRWGMSRMFPRWAMTADGPVSWRSATESLAESRHKAA